MSRPVTGTRRDRRNGGHVLPPVPEPAPDRLEDAREIAAWLDVPTSWVREAARNGTIPCVRLGRYVRFHRPAVAKAIGLE